MGRGLQIAIGLTNAIIKTGIKVVGHHHDFYWERDYFDHPNYDFVKELLEEYCPPKEIENMKHVVINKLAQNDLLEKKGLNSDVVPNVFDFDAPLWVEDDYNKTYRNDMGLKDNQVVFLQATRVTNRKAIELAIDLIALLNKEEFKQKLIGKQLYNGKAFNKDTELVLAMVGMHEGGEGYEEKIIQYAKENDVNLIVKPELIAHARHLEDGKKVYSLWDAYVHCDMITYPSIYEGWGNQFLEGLFAKKPQIVFEYSVFESDIISYDFDYISLGNEYKVGDKSLAKISDIVLRKAANETIEYLTNKDKYSACVSKNFKIAKKELSLDSLERVIIPIVDGVKR
ncbi:MAG: glycosyltransferase [Clostridiales bacterium]|nr:glycosyltransferase [Clostridiales bacterium]